jgi:CubicO group peptidase (beta-lactamase class C family)
MTLNRRHFLHAAAAGAAAATSASLWPSVSRAADTHDQVASASAGASLDAAKLKAAVESVRQKHNVPAISAAFYADGQLVTASAGIANVATGIEATQDTIMHIGSITKIFTATLVMQLVDEGKVALERPVIDYLSDFRVADPAATKTITVGELLNHTSGIDANLLPDDGHDLETIQNTITRFQDAPQLHAPGQARSYCNAGMVVAGYLCQRITGTSWYDLVKQKILDPLGLDHAVVLPEDAVLYRTSVGHYLDPATHAPVRTPLAFLPIGYSPAGSTAMMTASDLMTFGRAHMAGGIGPNGKRILSASAVSRMRQPLFAVTGPQTFDCTIAWQHLGGLLHHGGGGPGIISLLVTHPESSTAIVVLTNADYGVSAVADLVRPFVKTRLGIDTFPDPPKATPGLAVDAARYVGKYENSSVVHEVTATANGLSWTAYGRESYDAGSRAEHLPVQTLIAAGEDRFLAGTSVIKFYEPLASGAMRYLGLDLWLYQRTPLPSSSASSV